MSNEEASAHDLFREIVMLQNLAETFGKSLISLSRDIKYTDVDTLERLTCSLRRIYDEINMLEMLVSMPMSQRNAQMK